MLRIIVSSWLRRKERFILLLIGVLTMSSGLSFLFNISETNKGTVVNTLQQSWKSTYDIVVRTPESLSLFDQEENLLEPNYLSNIQGGISLSQYEQIKQIEDVEVAAPVAVMGYTGILIHYKEDVSNLAKEPGIYKMTNTMSHDGSYQTEVYFSVGKDFFINDRMAGNPLENGLFSHSTQLLVGIDPDQEAKLVGLDKSLAKFGENKYFNEMTKSIGSNQSFTIPVLVNPNPLDRLIYKNKLVKLDVEKSDIKELRKKNQDEILKFFDNRKIPGNETFSFSSSGQEMKEILFHDVNNKTNPFTGEKIDHPSGEYTKLGVMFYKTSPISYSKITSPFKEKWPFAYEVNEKQLIGNESYKFQKNTFRNINSIPVSERPTINFNVIGFFDPNKLTISKDPLSELPMETYRKPGAQLVLDENNQPINPPQNITSSGTPVGLFTEQPTMITTIQASELINGDRPISAIRIKVAGTDQLGEDSQKRVERVAEEIKRITGLQTDITLGSSPQPVLIHVKQKQGILGWMEQPWIHLGAAITIFKETFLGFSGMIAAVIAVAIIYVVATNIVSLLSRKKEFAILLSLGWRTKDLVKLIFIEAAILSSISLLFLWMISLIWSVEVHPLSIFKVVKASIFILIIYFVGTTIPAYMISKILPYEALKNGEISITSRRFVSTNSRFKMALNNLLGKFQRNILSILAIALPTSLAAFFLFITIRLQGVLYTTWLGSFLAMKIGIFHYIAVGIAFVIAILTITEIIWQNTVERKAEFSLLMAIGWKNSSVRLQILLEGLFIGLLGGILGILLTIIILFSMYGSISITNIGFLICTLVIPIIMGIIGSILPSQQILKISPFIELKK